MNKIICTLLICLSFAYSYSQADLCLNATPITVDNNTHYYNGSLSGATLTSALPGCAPNATQDVWYKFVASEATITIILNQNVFGDLYAFEVMEDSCNGNIKVCSTLTVYVANNYIVGHTYFIRIFNSSATVGSGFELQIKAIPKPANDECASALVLTPNAAGTLTQGTLAGATCTNSVTCAGTTTQDVWCTFTATAATMSLYTYSTPTMGFEIYDGNCNGTLVGCVNSGTTDNYYLNDNFVVGHVYFIRTYLSGPYANYGFRILLQEFSTPVNDLCANAISLTPADTCVPVSGTLGSSSISTPLPSCGLNASEDVWYKFVANEAMMKITVASTNQSWDHGFEIFEGSCTGNSIVCVNSNAAGNNETYWNNNFIIGQTYYVRVFNASGGISALPFTICIQKYPPPANDLCANATTLLPTASYQYTTGSFLGATTNNTSSNCSANVVQDVWYKFVATNTSMKVGLVSSTPYVTPFEIMEIYEGSCSGNLLFCGIADYYASYLSNNFVVGQTYFVRISNASQEIDATFNVNLQKFPPPANDLCASAITITPDIVCTPIYNQSFAGATINSVSPGCAVNALQDLWYKFVANSRMLNIRVFNDLYEILNDGFQIFEGSCSGTSSICINSGLAGEEENYTNSNFIVGQTYYIRVFNVGPTLSDRDFAICIRSYTPPVNDLCANAIEIQPSANCTQTTGTFSGASVDLPLPVTGANASQDVWYKFTAATTALSFYLEDKPSMDHGFEIFEGSCTGPVISSTNSHPVNYGETATVNNLIEGMTYYLRVFNAANTTFIQFKICTYDPSLSVDEANAAALQLHPNPATDTIVIEGLDLNQQYTFEIINQLGQRIEQSRLEANSKTIDLKTLNAGIYILKLHKGNQEMKSMKFIKK